MERDSLAGPIQPTALTQVGEHGYHGTSAQRSPDALGVTRAAFPLDIWQRTQEHFDGLLREFALIVQDAEARAAAPGRLLDLVAELTTGIAVPIGLLWWVLPAVLGGDHADQETASPFPRLSHRPVSPRRFRITSRCGA